MTFEFFTRSEKVSLINVTIDNEAEYFVMGELGKLGVTQIIDISGNENPQLLKHYHKVKYCDDLQQKLDSMKLQLQENEIKMISGEMDSQVPPIDILNDLGQQISEIYDQIREMKKYLESLAESFDRQNEICFMLNTFDALNLKKDERESEPEESNSDNILSDMIGIGDSKCMSILKRAIDHVTYKKACVTIVGDPYSYRQISSGKNVFKSVFRIITQGEELTKRCLDACDKFGISLYQNLKSTTAMHQKALDCYKNFCDTERLYETTFLTYKEKLDFVGTKLASWSFQLLKSKSIFDNLNKCSYNSFQNCMVIHFWCPTSDEDEVYRCLETGLLLGRVQTRPIIQKMTSLEAPPTLNRWSQSYMPAFQALIDSYVAATYREINPAPIYLITFPFLFSIMFADVAHGSFLLLISLLMIIFYDRIVGYFQDTLRTILDARYLILMMGIFSIYSGLILNDVMSKSIVIFQTGWKDSIRSALESNEASSSIGEEHSYLTLDPKFASTAYPFGLDYMWYFADNKLAFANSIKMKLSIIISTVHNIFGLFIKFKNLWYFRQTEEIFFSLIPEVVFYLSTFGYLTFLIFYKWLMVNSQSPNQPSIMRAFTGMFMELHKEIPDEMQFFSGQRAVQIILFFLTVVSALYLLLSKPLFQLWKARTNNLIPFYEIRDSDEDGLHEYFESSESSDDFSGIIIHQTIHTIEYCLGCISSTASYLRLWALSLAHSELSEVIWMLMKYFAFPVNGVSGLLMTLIASSVWMCLNIALMILMEGLSAFLHALRLHWVEFQGKFFMGTGELMKPYSFKCSLEDFEREYLSS